MKKSKFPAIYLTIMTILTFVPIVVTIVYSFNASKITSVWGGFSLSWYEELFHDRDLFRALRNSLILGFAACMISAVIGTLGAIGVKRTNWKINDVISYISTLPIMIPEIILGMVYLAVFSFMGFKFGMLTLIIAHTSFCIPYIFMMVSDRLIGMDPQIEEAARDLGASPVQVFFDITLPSIVPAILSGLLLSFAMSFDDVVISVFVTGSSVNTLPIKIYTRMKTGVTPEINALATVMILVTMTILVLNRVYMRKHS
ncbi:MAG: ABC transporter permease [Lachnospiraceae bacterium]|nr:ABC transporter permease [Lachnospiraceae bacterium]